MSQDAETDMLLLLVHNCLHKLVLKSLVTLLEQPNPDDPLMTDIAEIYSTDQAKFQKNAKEHTKKVPYLTFFSAGYLCLCTFWD